MNRIRDCLIDFGQRLRDTRDFLGLSQKDFSEKLGTSNSFISDIEQEKTKPGYKILMKMAHVFNISPNFILLGKGKMFLEEQEDLGQLLDFGDDTGAVVDMLRYLRKSPLVKLTIMAYFSRFLLRNEDIIKIDIEREEKRRNEETEKR